MPIRTAEGSAAFADLRRLRQRSIVSARTSAQLSRVGERDIASSLEEKGMPTIEENQPCTILVEVEVAPGRQQQLIDALAEQVEEQLSNYPGFVSATWHATKDGRRVFTYAQWSSTESYEAFVERDRDRLKAIFNDFGAKLLKLDHPLRVARVIDARATKDG